MQIVKLARVDLHEAIPLPAREYMKFDGNDKTLLSSELPNPHGLLAKRRFELAFVDGFVRIRFPGASWEQRVPVSGNVMAMIPLDAQPAAAKAVGA